MQPVLGDLSCPVFGTMWEVHVRHKPKLVYSNHKQNNENFERNDNNNI